MKSPSLAACVLVAISSISLSSCSDPKVPQLQDQLAKSKEDQARIEGQLVQIKSDNATATAGFQATIAAQKSQIESLQQQVKESNASLTTLQQQVAATQVQQAAQKKDDLRQQSFGKAIAALKGIRSRIAVGMSKADYLALIRDANAEISSDLELQGIDISQFTVPKDWPATLNTDLGASILISLQAYKDVMILDSATAPDKFLPPPDDETQYVFKADLREIMDRWDIPILLKGKFKVLDVPFQDQSIGYFSKKTIETYDISELHTLKQTGALVMWSDGGDATRQMLFTIASKAMDSAGHLLTLPVPTNPSPNTVTASGNTK